MKQRGELIARYRLFTGNGENAPPLPPGLLGLRYKKKKKITLPAWSGIFTTICPPASSSGRRPRKRFQEKWPFSRSDVYAYLAQKLTGTEKFDLLLLLLDEEAPDHFSWEIPKHLKREMRALISTMKWSHPREYRIRPSNTPAVLLHWRALGWLTGKLSQRQWEKFFSLGQTEEAPGTPEPVRGSGSGTAPIPPPRPTQLRPSTSTASTPGSSCPPPSGTSNPRPTFAEAASTPFVPRAFDSHFHLDRMEISLEGKGLALIHQHCGRPPHKDVRLTGGVVNYCDPSRFGKIRFPADRNWMVAIGDPPEVRG